MTDPAALTTDPPKPSRSGRLLSLVRNLIDYGLSLAAALRQRATATDDAPDLTRVFGTGNLRLILARIACGLFRAGLLENKIVLIGARIDAPPPPRPVPTPRAPRVIAPPPEPRQPTRSQPQPTDTASLLAALPTADQIAARMRRQPIGVVLADICRDLGIARGHPLWDQLHRAINEFGGNFMRLCNEWLNRAFPIAPIVARLKAAPPAPPPPIGTGPPGTITA